MKKTVSHSSVLQTETTVV